MSSKKRPCLHSVKHGRFFLHTSRMWIMIYGVLRKEIKYPVNPGVTAPAKL
jgi:hypothetical protein